MIRFVDGAERRRRSWFGRALRMTSQGNQFGFPLALEDPQHAARCLRLNTASKPSSTRCLRTR